MSSTGAIRGFLPAGGSGAGKARISSGDFSLRAFPELRACARRKKC